MNLYVTKNMNAFILPNLPTGAVCFSFYRPPVMIAVKRGRKRCKRA